MAQVDFYSMLSGIGDTIAAKRKESMRRDALAGAIQPDGTVDFNRAIMGLAKAGDMETAARVQALKSANDATARDARDFAFRQQEAQRSQGNTDRSFRLQERQATEKPQYMKNDAGEIVEIKPYGGGARVLTPEGVKEPSNPFMTGGKMNEAQSKDALYASRMLNAEKVFQNPNIASAGQSAWEVGKAKLPGAGTFYNPNTPEYQQFDQARRDFINATLRRESGAVIADSEFANAERQYFPKPGDSEAVLKQKAANRREAIKGIGAGAGPGYRPELTFDQSGKVVPRVAPQGSGITKEQYDALPSGATYTAPDGSQRVKK